MMMESENVSKDPHEASVSVKAMPKLVRLEGRSFPRNVDKEGISSASLESRSKEDFDGPSKSFDTLEIQRKPYRRTHEEIEDFVAKRQRRNPADRDNNPKHLSYSTNKTDISSIEKQTNGYDPPRHKNGKGLHPQRGLSKQGEDRGLDYLFSRRCVEEDNDLSRVNFIPGSSSSSKLLNEKPRHKYLQPFSSSVSINGNRSSECQSRNLSFSKDDNSKSAFFDKPLDSIHLVEKRSSENANTLGRHGDEDCGIIAASNRYENFEHEKDIDASSDSNVPLNLQKTFSNVKGGATISTNAISPTTTLTMIRPNSSRKSSPASTVSSASSIPILDTLHEGNHTSIRNTLRPTDTDLDLDCDEQSSFQKNNGGKMYLADPSATNYLGRVSRNSDIIITSMPRSPSSSNSSSKEELDEFQKGNQKRHHLRKAQMSSNDKELPQGSFPDSISATLISQMNSSPDNIARRGELLISPAPKESDHNAHSPILNDKRFSNPKYVLALSPPPSSVQNMSSVQRQTEDEDECKNKKYGSLKVSSYLLNRHRERESSPPLTRIPLSLSDRLDSDCSRLLSSKRDLIVERVIQPELETASEVDLTPSSEEHSLDRGTNFKHKTDYTRFDVSNHRVGNDGSMSSDIAHSSAGALRLKQFSKSLTGTNVIQMSKPGEQSSLSLTKVTSGKGHLFKTLEGRHDGDDLTNKIVGLSSLQLEQFEKRNRFDPAKSSSSTSSSRPETESLIDVFNREKTLYLSSKSYSEEISNNQNINDMSSGDNLAKIPCDYCDHLFNREADLNDHVGRFHAGVKKYVCFVCHKRFKRKQSLENHVLMIHGVSGSGATPGGSGRVTNANVGVNHNNGNILSGRTAEMTSREQMIMMMIEKGKAELAAGRLLQNGNIGNN